MSACALERRRPAWPSDARVAPPRSGPGRSRGRNRRPCCRQYARRREHLWRNSQLRYVAEVLLGLADLRGVAQRGAEQPLVIGLERDDALALRQHQPPERHHPLAAHGFTNEREGLLSDRLAGRDVIRGVEETLVDLRARHKAVDLDRVGALNLDRFQLGIIDNEELGPWRPR